MLTLHTLKRAAGATHKKKVVGRGRGSGKGKFSTRGNKGQTKRTGHSKLPAVFEGGRMPLVRQLPKLRGFRSLNEKPVAISLDKLSQVFNDGDTVNRQSLIVKGLIKPTVKRVKILKGQTSKRLKIEVPMSASVKKVLASPS